MSTATAATTKSNADQLQVGDHWSRNSYGQVVAINQDAIRVKSESDLTWEVDPPLFEAEFHTADQFTSTKKVTRTEMVQKIIESARIAMTIFFHKQANPKDLKQAVNALLVDVASQGRSAIPKDRALGKLLKEATAGAERTMVGRHFGTTDEFGRIQFLDVESSSPGLKTVDPRTVDWAIIGNVRYELK